MTETPEAPAAMPEPPKPVPPQRPIAQAFAQNLHAVLVGGFTILSSIISALLGYYFGHEDQKRLLALEYDKLRAEHTLEITKALVTAEAALQELLLTGRDSSKRYCIVANQLAALKTDLVKIKPMPPLGGTLNDILAALGPLIQNAGAPEHARLDLLARLRTMRNEHDELDKKIQASWRKDDEVRNRLNGDTAAMVRVYYRDRSLEFSQLTGAYDQVGLQTRRIVLENGLCNLEPKWEEAQAAVIDWDKDSFMFSGSLGLELKPD